LVQASGEIVREAKAEGQRRLPEIRERLATLLRANLRDGGVYLPSSKSGVVGRYGEDHMPTTYVVNPDGVVKLVKDGFETGDADGEKKKLKQQLDDLMR